MLNFEQLTAAIAALEGNEDVQTFQHFAELSLQTRNALLAYPRFLLTQPLPASAPANYWEVVTQFAHARPPGQRPTLIEEALQPRSTWFDNTTLWTLFNRPGLEEAVWI